MIYRLLIIAIIAMAPKALAVPGSAGDQVISELASAEAAASHEFNREYDLAIVAYAKSISTVEDEFGPYSEHLIEPLIGMARGYAALGAYPEAISASSRAQHLSHRSEGVYSLKQLEVLDLLTTIHMANDEATQADRLQSFSLFISEHNFDQAGMALLPALKKISAWYVDTGQFNRAEQVLDRSQDIIISQGGMLDPVQLPWLITKAKVKRLRGVCCSHRVLEGALDIIQANPDLSKDLKVEFYIALADSYTVTGNTDSAADYYQLAWTLMSAPERKTRFGWPKEIALSKKLDDKPINLRIYRLEKERFGQPDLTRITPQEKLILDSLPPQRFLLPVNDNEQKVRIRDRNYGNPDLEKVIRVVGHPFQFIHRQLKNILPLSLHSDEKLNQLGIELSFTVGRSGNIYDVEVTSAHIPVKLRRLMSQVLRKSKFRPRMVDGELTETTHVTLYQTFEP